MAKEWRANGLLVLTGVVILGFGAGAGFYLWQAPKAKEKLQAQLAAAGEFWPLAARHTNAASAIARSALRVISGLLPAPFQAQAASRLIAASE